MICKQLKPSEYSEDRKRALKEAEEDKKRREVQTTLLKIKNKKEAK